MLTHTERERYDRQLLIDGFGIEGQEKLRQSRVLIAGAGGLGSPISIYLASAGVGNILIIDRDELSLSNLNRQILYHSTDLGRKKAEAAGEKLKKINPDIDITYKVETISENNIYTFLDGCNLILDGTDNFPTRYILNRAALKMEIPYIYGGIYGIEGALTTIIPEKTACLRCIFQEPPSPVLSPVLGVTAGVIGCLQAMEAIKYITGIGNLLTNRLMIFDGFTMKTREFKIKRNPHCPDCSQLKS